MKLTLPTSAGRRTYAALATELHRVADSIAGLPGSHVYAKLDIQPGPTDGDRDEIVRSVDAVATVVLGRPGKTDDFGGGMVHHRAIASAPVLNVAIYQRVPGLPDPKDAEIERLRAELAVERTAKEFAQSHLGTEGAVSQPKPDTLLTEYTGRAPVPHVVAVDPVTNVPLCPHGDDAEACQLRHDPADYVCDGCGGQAEVWADGRPLCRREPEADCPNATT